MKLSPTEALKIIGDKPIQKVHVAEINALLKTLSEKRMSHGGVMARVTLKHVRTHLLAVFKLAVDRNIIRNNPVASSSAISDANPIGGRPLTKEQARRLCQIGTAFYDAGLLRLWPAIFTALCTGVRRGELFAITWADIDFAQNRIDIHRALARAPHGYVVGPPKTKTSNRVIPLPSDVSALLLRHRVQQEAELEQNGVKWTSALTVFCTNVGQVTSPDNMFRSLQCLLAWSDPDRLIPVPGRPHIWRGVEVKLRPALMDVVRAGEAVPRIGPHDLRHTYATLMLRRGVPVEVVSKLLGHASVIITLSVYRKVFSDEITATGSINVLSDEES